jgi:hypothetical protein
MPSGGARSRSGPAPDPNALRRDRPDDAGWRKLPAVGREGDVPEWPLSDASGRELELWEAEWSRPQAVVWEENGQEVEVALFVRSLVDAELPRATAATRTLVRQQMEALGLTVPGMARNRWMIVEDEAPARRKPKGRGSARDRLKVVESGEAS